MAKHWITGDIHGAFSVLWAELLAKGFNPNQDTLYSVGDLVNRGKESPAALEWLHKPWFKPILGNHESMVASADASLLSQVGAEWWLKAGDAFKEKASAMLSALPLTRTLDVNGARIGIVHADVLEGVAWDKFCASLLAGDKAATSSALWSRSRWSASVGCGLTGEGLPLVDGVDWVFVGHSPVTEPTIVGNVVFIDCGLWRGNTNGILCLDDWLAVRNS